MVNAITVQIPTNDWVLILIPSWIYYGIVVLFWFAMIQLPSCTSTKNWKSCAAMLAAFCQHAMTWLGLFYMARYWDRDVSPNHYSLEDYPTLGTSTTTTTTNPNNNLQENLYGHHRDNINGSYNLTILTPSTLTTDIYVDHDDLPILLDYYWYFLSIPFYLAIFCRCYCSLAAISSLRNLQSKMISRQRWEQHQEQQQQTTTTTNTNEDTLVIDESDPESVLHNSSSNNNKKNHLSHNNNNNNNMDMLPDGYIVVTKNTQAAASQIALVMLADSNYTSIPNNNSSNAANNIVTHHQEDDLTSKNVEQIIVETSPEYKQVDHTALLLYRNMIQMAVLGTCFVTLMALKLEGVLGHISFWLIFTPVWIHLAHRLWSMSRRARRQPNSSTNNNTTTPAATTGAADTTNSTNTATPGTGVGVTTSNENANGSNANNGDKVAKANDSNISTTTTSQMEPAASATTPSMEAAVALPTITTTTTASPRITGGDGETSNSHTAEKETDVVFRESSTTVVEHVEAPRPPSATTTTNHSTTEDSNDDASPCVVATTKSLAVGESFGLDMQLAPTIDSTPSSSTSATTSTSDSNSSSSSPSPATAPATTTTESTLLLQQSTKTETIETSTQPVVDPPVELQVLGNQIVSVGDIEVGIQPEPTTTTEESSEGVASLNVAKKGSSSNNKEGTTDAAKKGDEENDAAFGADEEQPPTTSETATAAEEEGLPPVHEEFERWQSVYENTEVRTLNSPYIPCEVFFQIIICCMIVAKLDVDYGNDDPEDAGFNAFLIILIPFSLGLAVCCCAIAVGCVHLAQEEMNLRAAEASALHNEGNNNNNAQGSTEGPTEDAAPGTGGLEETPMQAGPGLYQRVSFPSHIDITRKELSVQQCSRIMALGLAISASDAQAWLEEQQQQQPPPEGDRTSSTNETTMTFWEQITACAQHVGCQSVNYDERCYNGLKPMDREWLVLLRTNLQAHFDKAKFQSELDAIQSLDDDDDDDDDTIGNNADGDDAEVGGGRKEDHVSDAVDCPVCCESFHITDTVHCEGDPLHFFCRPCFHRYATETIQSGDASGISCADVLCEAHFATPIVRANLSSWEILRMEDRETERNTKVALAAKAVLKCPCGAIAVVPEKDVGDGRVTCPGLDCGIQYCALCGNKWHPETNCPPTKKMLQWVVQNTMPCPNCHTPIEKNAGCDHMHCAPPGGCGHHFSYRTGKPMTKSGRSLRGLYNA